MVLKTRKNLNRGRHRYRYNTLKLKNSKRAYTSKRVRKFRSRRTRRGGELPVAAWRTEAAAAEVEAAWRAANERRAKNINKKPGPVRKLFRLPKVIIEKRANRAFVKQYNLEHPELIVPRHMEEDYPDLYKDDDEIDDEYEKNYALEHKPLPRPDPLTGKIDTSDLTGIIKVKPEPKGLFSRFTRKNKPQREPESDTASETDSDDSDSGSSIVANASMSLPSSPSSSKLSAVSEEPRFFPRILGKKQGQNIMTQNKMPQTNVTQTNVTQKKPWYKFWGGVRRTRKLNKLRKTRKVKRRELIPSTKGGGDLSDTASETDSDSDFEDYDDGSLTEIYDEVRADPLVSNAPEKKPGFFSRMFGKKQGQNNMTQYNAPQYNVPQYNVPQFNVTQQKPWYKFWGGVRHTRKLSKTRKQKHIVRKRRLRRLGKRRNSL